MKLTDIKRQNILRAAKSAFGKNGFTNANMSNIAADANVSKRTLYNHFSSKEQLFTEILKDNHKMVTDRPEFHYRPELPITEQFMQIVMADLEFKDNIYDVNLTRTIVMEFMRRPEYAQSLITELYSRNGFYYWLKDAVADKALIIESIDDACLLYKSMFNGFFLWPQVITSLPEVDEATRLRQVKLIVSSFLTNYLPK